MLLCGQAESRQGMWWAPSFVGFKDSMFRIETYDNEQEDKLTSGEARIFG